MHQSPECIKISYGLHCAARLLSGGFHVVICSAQAMWFIKNSEAFPPL